MTKFPITIDARESESTLHEYINPYESPIPESTERLHFQHIDPDQTLYSRTPSVSLSTLSINTIVENHKEIWNLFGSLPSIRCLEINDYVIPLEKKNKNLKHQPAVLPSCFGQLKSLKLGLVSVVAPTGSTEDRDEAFDIPSAHWTMNVLQHCPNLQTLGYPTLPTENSCKRFLENINDSLKANEANRKNNKAKQEQFLQTVDLERFSFEDLDYYSLKPTFHKFLSICVSNGIKILNFDINCTIGEELTFREGGFGKCIQSIFSVVDSPIPFFSSYDLPNVDCIKIKGNSWEDEDLCLSGDWPKLESLSIDLEAEWTDASPPSSWVQILETLVYSEPRPKVQDLSIRIVANEDKLTVMDEKSEVVKLLRANRPSLSQRKREGFSSLIKIPLITANFPNLVSLSMVGWNVSDAELANLWSELPKLKKLTIADIATASDLAFIGKDIRNPAFLQLKGLEKLTLNLDKMPDVTEAFFIDVLAKMKLQDCALEGDKLKNETMQGLGVLFGEKCSTSIEDCIIESGCCAINQ